MKLDKANVLVYYFSIQFSNSRVNHTMMKPSEPRVQLFIFYILVLLATKTNQNISDETKYASVGDRAAA